MKLKPIKRIEPEPKMRYFIFLVKQNMNRNRKKTVFRLNGKIKKLTAINLILVTLTYRILSVYYTEYRYLTKNSKYEWTTGQTDT